MLIAPNVAIGDYGILEMVESAGANIVIEDVFEGMLDYRYDGRRVAAPPPVGAPPPPVTHSTPWLERGSWGGCRRPS